MLPLQLLADEMNRQRRAETERLRPSRQLAALRRTTRRGRRLPRQTVQAVRKAFQLRA
jgi:hypothetical protein